MSAQTNDSSGQTQRKSTRNRQKRSLGDDFIDPTVSLSSIKNQQPPAKKKAISKSPTLSQEPQDTDGTLALKNLIEHIKDEPLDEEEVVVNTRRKSGRQVKPTLKMKMAEKEVKQEIEEVAKDTKPGSLLDSPPASGSEPDGEKSPTPANKPARSAKKQPNNKKQAQKKEEEDEEKRLNNAAMDNVAAICAANVQKILAKRTLGRFSTGSQEIAQNAEISRYVATKGDCPDGPNVKFLTLANRTIAVPPKSVVKRPTTPPGRPRPRPLPSVRPTNVPYIPRQCYVNHRQGDRKKEDSGRRLMEANDPLAKYLTVSNTSYQADPKGGAPSLVRTVTLIPPPLRSMHLDADGNPPGPSNREPPPRPPVVKPNTIRTVIARGPDGKPLPIRRFIYPNPPGIPRPKPTSHSEADDTPPPLLDKHNNLVTVKPVKVNNMYETMFSPSEQVNYHPNQPQFLYPVATKKPETVLDVKEIKKEVEEPSEQLEKQVEPETKFKPADLNEAGRRMVLVCRTEPANDDLFSMDKEDNLYEDSDDADSDFSESFDGLPSPPIVFLGADEPMKDLDEDKYRFRQYELKTVEKFTSRHFRSFGKRPPGQASLNMLPGAPGLSAVLIAEVDEDKYNAMVEQWKVEEEAETAKEMEKYEEEKLRQQQARAQKLTLNETRIVNYMQSDEFLSLQKPESEMTPFERLVAGPDAVNTLSAYNESLSMMNPMLLRHLHRLQGSKKKDKANQNNIFPVRSYKKKESQPARLSGPVRLQQPLPMTESGHKPSLKENKMPAGPPKKLKVVWNGITQEVPEWISCHLCRDLMRLCMRKSNYRGELREYPAYRCLRKGCQTFRSVKKIIRDPNEPPQNFAKKPVCESPDRLLSRSVGEYLRCGRTARIRKNKFDELSKDFVCSSSAEEVARNEFDEEEDEEEDELVEWSDYPGASTTTTAEELRAALLSSQNQDNDIVKRESDETMEDQEYNPYFEDEDDELSPEIEETKPNGLMEIKQEIIEEEEEELQLMEQNAEVVDQKPDISTLDTKNLTLTLHTPSC